MRPVLLQDINNPYDWKLFSFGPSTFGTIHANGQADYKLDIANFHIPNWFFMV